MHKPLIVCDFDGTIANTFARSPHGINVAIAYDLAVRTLFGEKGAELYSNQLGGLQNREPLELVTEIMQAGSETGIQLNFSGTIQDATERLVQLKLSYLLPEISSSWPRLYEGVSEFFQLVTEGKIPIEVAVVSSGHDAFIRKTFEVNGITPPNNLVTSDVIRHLTEPRRPLYKPYSYQLAKAHKQWLMNNNVYQDGYMERAQGKPYMMFIGDDRIKDGGLAKNSRIVYAHVRNSQPDYIPDPEKGQFLLPDFFVLADVLIENAEEIQKGLSLSEIFLGRKDAELFPPLMVHERPYIKWLKDGKSHSKERF